MKKKWRRQVLNINIREEWCEDNQPKLGEAWLRGTLGRSDRESDQSGKVEEKSGWSAGRVTQEQQRRGEENESSSPPSTDASIPPGSRKKPGWSQPCRRGTHTLTHANNASLRSHPLTLPSSYNLKAETGHLLPLSLSASSDFWRFFVFCFFFVCRIVEAEHSGRGGQGGRWGGISTLSNALPLCLFSCCSL